MTFYFFEEKVVTFWNDRQAISFRCTLRIGTFLQLETTPFQAVVLVLVFSLVVSNKPVSRI